MGQRVQHTGRALVALGAGGQLDEAGGQLGGVGVAEGARVRHRWKSTAAPGGGVDPLAAPPADLDRLDEDPARLVEVAEEPTLEDRVEGGQDLRIAQDVGVIGSVSRYQAYSSPRPRRKRAPGSSAVRQAAGSGAGWRARQCAEQDREMQATVGHVLGPEEGEVVRLLALGARFMIDGGQTGGAFSLVEHPLPPRALGAPLHTHHDEDEYSYVLEGRVGVQLGPDEIEAGPGDLVVKPRGIAHTFWNAGDEPARLLELISPAGFENYFRELAPLLAAAERDQAAIGAVVAATTSTSTSGPSPRWPERHGLRLEQA